MLVGASSLHEANLNDDTEIGPEYEAAIRYG
jgi:hypothetical protein